MDRYLVMLVSLIVALAVCAPPARSDLFQYTDDNGTTVMVDDEGKIPAKFRKKLKASKSSSGGSRITAVRVRNNRVYVPVQITYRSRVMDTWMLLDTGASTTVITASLADRLGIGSASTERGMAQIADGSVIQTQRTRVDHIAVGPKLKNFIEISIVPSNGPISDYDGLLGMNFLGDFRYHLDINNQTIEWQ
jgi:clan AA aspartic protease (TIGR02281 family)